jgi:branched-chain amino acid transport system substrate-binding protein
MLFSVAPVHAADIKLGFVGDLSGGSNAAAGVAAVAGIKAAISDINAKGGILGQSLTLVVRDDQAQPARSLQDAIELIDNEKVAALLGPSNSGNAMAWKRIATEKKTVAFMVIAEATDITKPLTPGGDSYFFRDALYDRARAAALTAYAKSNGAKKVGFLTETTGSGEGGLRDLQRLSKLHDLTVGGSDKFAASDTDMTSQLSRFKDANIDTVIVWAQGTPTGLLLRSMEKIAYFPKVLASGGASTPEFVNAAGAKLAEAPISTRINVAPISEAQKSLFARVEAQLPDPMTFVWAMQGYDGVVLLAAGIKQAGTVDGDKIREALETLDVPIKGVIKDYNKPFTPSEHEAIKPSDAKFVRQVSGKLVFYTDSVTNSLTPSELNQ